eukprot:1154062-Pelagomonas_calceolata.AAC.4
MHFKGTAHTAPTFDKWHGNLLHLSRKAALQAFSTCTLLLNQQPTEPGIDSKASAAAPYGRDLRKLPISSCRCP